MIRIAIVGYGYWGPNLARNIEETPGATVAAIIDASDDRLAIAAQRHPGAAIAVDLESALRDHEIDAVAIATPVESHYSLALAALQADKHVLVEKPMTATAQQAERLTEEAGRRHLVLMVDHTFVYTGAVRKIAELMSTGELGKFYYYDSLRVNLGLFQPDVNVVSDLAVHDLAILDHVLAEQPIAVCANGLSHFRGTPENLAYVSLFYESGAIAHLNVNWLAPVKIRQTLIGGSKKMIVYNDMEPSEKIKVYDKGISILSDCTR
jgi:predicted dehydrogenase